MHVLKVKGDGGMLGPVEHAFGACPRLQRIHRRHGVQGICGRNALEALGGDESAHNATLIVADVHRLDHWRALLA